MQDPNSNPFGDRHPLLYTLNAIPISLCVYAKIKSRARLLLPLVRSDDLGIEAGEVLVDLVLGVVCGFL